MILVAGCMTLPPEEEAEVTTVTVPELWDGVAAYGETVTVKPIVVTSPRTTSGDAFFVSDPAGGEKSGLLVRFGAVFDKWPPKIGNEVKLTIVVESAGGPPIGRVFGEEDAKNLGAIGLPPPSPPGEFLEHGLVLVQDLTVTSAPDPHGEADTDGAYGIGGLFGVSPGWGRSGDLVGILDDGRVSATAASGWSGELDGDPPIVTSVAGLAELADGTTVEIEDLLLATPWSRDGRTAVLQGRRGNGVWVDAEAWGLQDRVEPGDVATWTAEVRHDADGLYLRAWDPPLLAGTRDRELGEDLVDGAIVATTVSGIGPPDATGERPSDGLLLDDRFLDLADLPDPADVVGAVRATRLCPFEVGE